MGIFDNISDYIEPAIGAGAGFAAGGPIGAAIGGGLGFNIAGARKQVKALEAAGRVQEANALKQDLRFMELLRETKGFRELAAEQIPRLREESLAEAGTSPEFMRLLERGATGIRQQFSKAGLGKSSNLALALGEFGAGLTARDRERLTNLRLSLLRGATTGFDPALRAGQGATGASSRYADLLATQGAVRGGTLGDIGSSLITLPLLSSTLRNAATTPGTTTAPGGAGPFTLESPVLEGNYFQRLPYIQ